MQTIEQVMPSTEDDYKDLCKRATTNFNKEGQSHYVIDVSEVKDWTVDLRGVPSVETGDIMIYLLSTCQWSDDRLRDYKQDNGYKLYISNHISESADPYNTWVLMDSTGYLKSGGCTCVADDGSCKHVVALLFALSSFVSRHTDRHTLVGTDTICAWDKPKQETKPSKIAELEYFA
ncbi:unnamed protein product [Mytilus edulis]|uniref:SWIM-type domain-containing protein n=1 Tax=Mytilus edulis TaxID=6550 RepID=A0A8S3RX52_MYTED|nr:unnamed protein product [Mytilus edulis]